MEHSWHQRLCLVCHGLMASWTRGEGVVLHVANQRFSAVTAQRAILPADAREGGLSKFYFDYCY